MAAVNPNTAVNPLSPSATSWERTSAPRRAQEDPPAPRVSPGSAPETQNAPTASVSTDEKAAFALASSQPSREELHSIAESFGQIVSAVNKGISIRIDDKADMFVTEIVNKQTNEVIKQIPPEQLVRLAGRLREFLGILLDIEV